MYRVGDDVTYSPKDIKAKIIRVLPNDEYRVEFYDKALIPPQMDVSGFYLSPVRQLDLNMYGYNHIYGTNKETHCPRCGNEWKETWIGHRPLYDCLKCNLKKEDV